jgi:hypothetical protein
MDSSPHELEHMLITVTRIDRKKLSFKTTSESRLSWLPRGGMAVQVFLNTTVVSLSRHLLVHANTVMSLPGRQKSAALFILLIKIHEYSYF